MLASSTRRRYARRAAVVVVAGAGAATLVACQKPLPQVTFQSGSRSVLVAPSTYCYDDQDPTNGVCPPRPTKTIALTAAPGSSISISVPRSVASQAWIASAYTFAADGTAQAQTGLGTSVIQDNHYARVPVPDATGSYQLQVVQLRGGDQVGAWIVQVNVEN